MEGGSEAGRVGGLQAQREGLWCNGAQSIEPLTQKHFSSALVLRWTQSNEPAVWTPPFPVFLGYNPPPVRKLDTGPQLSMSILSRACKVIHHVPQHFATQKA